MVAWSTKRKNNCLKFARYSFCQLFVVLFLFIGILIVLTAEMNWNFSASSQSAPSKKISMNKILFWIEMSKNNNIDLSMIRHSQLIL